MDILGCVSGRESDRWIDFDFFGHQLVAHLVDPQDHSAAVTNPGDDHAVPASHCGLMLDWELYQEFVDRLSKATVDVVIEPYLRCEGLRVEQATLFIRDPSNNYLEFKAFRDINMLFDKDIDSY